ncbi:hypothetical protein [Burkholderia vietnamiensis]|uniref:hypothetical protein n=1 Tax=Burkholderia vietnamiensis TaxID=60552 RepID=UPI00352DACE0
MHIEASKFDDIVKSMVGYLDAQHGHVQTLTSGGKPVPFHLGYATASTALAAALQEHGITVSESGEEDEAFDLMLSDAENDLRAEGEKVYRVTHHYDIGDQDVYVEHPTGDVDGKRVALYLWFKACDWFGYSVLVSNLGIASVMVAFYGFRHCAIHPFSTTVDLYSDAEGFRGYEELMSDTSLHRDGLREALAPHVDGAAG